MKGIPVHLTLQELMLGATHGVMRHLHHIQRQTKPSENLSIEGSTWDLHINGALAELAVCKYRGAYWTGASKIGMSDASGLEVRTTTHEFGALRIRHEDREDDIFVLVITAPPTFTLKGWLTGGAGKQPRYWTSKTAGRYAFWVPQDDLNPMESINAAVRNRREKDGAGSRVSVGVGFGSVNQQMAKG